MRSNYSSFKCFAGNFIAAHRHHHHHRRVCHSPGTEQTSLRINHLGLPQSLLPTVTAQVPRLLVYSPLPVGIVLFFFACSLCVSVFYLIYAFCFEILRKIMLYLLHACVRKGNGRDRQREVRKIKCMK